MDPAPSNISLCPPRICQGPSPEECTEQVGGSIKCWGANEYGQMGDGTTVDRPAPVAPRGPWGRVSSRTDRDACMLAPDLHDRLSG